MPPKVPQPWEAFLHDLDGLLEEPVELHCIGGFVVAKYYGLDRPTADVDVLEVKPRGALASLVEKAGNGSPLHEKHGVYLQAVTVANHPDSYEERLTEMFPGVFSRLRLFALDPYDLALTKLERNAPRDREDVLRLARLASLDTARLRSRYEQEMRPYLGNPEREDLTLRLWIDTIEEDREESRTD